MTRLCLLAVLALVSTVHGFYPTAFELKQKEKTDACLSDVSKIATAVPKIIDDIKRGDMISLMTDVMNTIPLFNQTKNDCSGFHTDDMINQTTMNNLKYCTQSFGPIVDSLEVVFEDIIRGRFTQVYDHVLIVLSNAAYSLRVCANIADFIEYPKVIFNFYNTTQCWNSHQRSANLMHAILHDLQTGNITDALNLALPFVSATADSLRFCTVNLSSFDNTTSYNMVEYYSFIENVPEVKATKKDECKTFLAEAIAALTAEPQDLGKVVSLIPKFKNCAGNVDVAQLVKNPVVRQIVSLSMAKGLKF